MMKKYLGILFLLASLLTISGCNLFQKKTELSTKSGNESTSVSAIVGLEIEEQPETKTSNSSLNVSDDAGVEDEIAVVEDVAVKEQIIESYVQYTPGIVDLAISEGKRVVLDFSAAWCPSCQFFQRSVESELSKIPEDIVLIKVNYDTEKDLKKQYKVTQQHTFVEIDADKNLVKKTSSSVRTVDDFADWVSG